jgi:DNA-binding response OmpR family regulator
MPKRILIVDDDADFRASVTEVLKAEGYEVLVATNGREGVEQSRVQHPDLIVLDIMMEHDWAGYEVNQAVKYASGETAATIPILMVSSIQVDPATLFYRATEVGMVTPDSYLTKPLDISEFLDRVRSLLGK